MAGAQAGRRREVVPLSGRRRTGFIRLAVDLFAGLALGFALTAWQDGRLAPDGLIWLTAGAGVLVLYDRLRR